VYLKVNITLLHHASEELINFIFTVSKVSSFDVVVGLLSPSTSGSVQLEWPKEVGCILEIVTNGKNFMHKVLYTDDVLPTQYLVDH